MPFLIAALVFGAVLAFGRWRRLNSVQWIWLLFGTALALIVIWLLVIVFFIGPEMREMDKPWMNGQ